MKRRPCLQLFGFVVLPVVVGLFLAREQGRQRGFTVAQRVEQLKGSFDERLRPVLLKAGITDLPKSVTLVYLKDKQVLEVWAQRAGSMAHVRTYPVTAASGGAGPKLREGDLQVPEGIYKVEALNPNSRFHLSLRLNYPNEFDRARAREEGRSRLGGDIMIHGNAVSTGCIAIGDEAIEELFLLAALTDWRAWKVISAPADFRVRKPEPGPGLKPWVPGLYEELSAELASLRFPAPAPTR